MEKKKCLAMNLKGIRNAQNLTLERLKEFLGYFPTLKIKPHSEAKFEQKGKQDSYKTKDT